MKKKKMGLVALLCMMLSLDASAFQVDGIEYDFGTAPFTVKVMPLSDSDQGTQHYSGEIDIQPTIQYDGRIYHVTEIGDNAFSGCSQLTAIKLPASVTKYGSGAFANCPLLTSFTIGNTVTHIDAQAFRGCTGLKDIVIPKSVTFLGTRVFSGCTSLKSVEIANAVASLTPDMFEYCLALRSATIHNFDSVKDWTYQFNNLSNKTVKLSNNDVLTIDDNGLVRVNKPGMVNITIDVTNPLGDKSTFKFDVCLGGVRATISDAGYATFSALSNYQVPGELKAGIIEVGDNRANFSYLEPTTSCYPSEEAVIVKGEPGEYFFPTPAGAPVLEKNANNSLKPVYTNDLIEAVSGNELFVLSQGNGGVGFYYQLGCPDGSFVKDMKGKAYLDLSVRFLPGLNGLILFDSEVTGIEAVEQAAHQPAVIYNLSGVRVNQSVDQLPKGLYIVNGQKVLVK